MDLPRLTTRQLIAVTLAIGLSLSSIVTLAIAGDLAFRRHVINPESEYSAVAVFDVNRDGIQDIFCGGFWYEAPTWRRHFVRDVERIRGRFDGYSHLPMDVNADGWTDVITVNYRSKSIRWIEHPGADLGPWVIHTVEEPGAMESGRLLDVDGDGRLDVLANGQQFAAWWSLEPSTDDARKSTPPRWTRHELPSELGGHGLGFGDIDGDGRGDAVGPLGWAAAPQDRRQERWIWSQEFNLARASLPVLVVDVDDDGDNDLVWTRAHGFGVYWMEQTKSTDGSRHWIHHTIDTSWSQCHSPLWADMDGDGKNELIAGKRYMAHEGLDPGAYDPLVSYRYQFDAVTRTWQRWVISENENVGFGLDPKVIDLDDDGDLDLVVCGRSGLYWLENEGPFPGPGPGPRPVTEVIAYEDHSELMVVRDPAGAAKPVRTPFDWGLRRWHVVSAIEKALGALPGPSERMPLDVRILQEHKAEDHTYRLLSYQAGTDRRVSAEIWLPTNDAVGELNIPGVVFVNPAANASSNADDEDALHRLVPLELARRGFACVSPQLVIPDGKTQGPATVAQFKLANTMADVWTCMRAVDLLESLPGVNGDRIGCIGNERGAQLALFAAALDQRILATVCSGDFPMAGIDPTDESQFAFPELVAAVIPRALALRVTGTSAAQDIEAMQQAVARATVVSALNRVAEPPTVESTGLTTSAETRLEAYEWLDGRLLSRGFSRRAPRR